MPNASYYSTHREQCREAGRRYYYNHRELVWGRSNDYKRKHTLTTGGKTYYGLEKRPRPNDEACELCGKVGKKLDYHHWDTNKSKGMWVCFACHRGCEAIDAGIIDQYLQLKAQINNTFERMG